MYWAKIPIICPIAVIISWRSCSALFASSAFSSSHNCFSQSSLSLLASSFAAITPSTIAFPAISAFSTFMVLFCFFFWSLFFIRACSRCQVQSPAEDPVVPGWPADELGVAGSQTERSGVSDRLSEGSGVSVLLVEEPGGSCRLVEGPRATVSLPSGANTFSSM